MNVVIYARYSSDGQTESSIEGQLRECKEYAERNNMTIAETYIDRALSAKTDNRPEFLKMVSDSSRKQFQAVLVWKLDRFARNRKDSATYRAILKRSGVKLISVKENISEGPEGIILEAMLEGMAEYYSAELSVKVKRGQTENALKCKANGGAIPFGYKINAERYYEIDPLTAPIILEIFTRYADGETVCSISADLNARGVFANNKHKYTHKASMHNLLKNRRYIGEYRYGKIITPGGMPAIVPKDIFKRVEERMKKNKHTPAAQKAITEYILTTKLFCGNDGAMMVGVSGTSKTGKKHHYYKCGDAQHRKACNRKAIKKDWIESHIVALVKDFVLRDNVIEDMTKLVLERQNRENTTLPLLQKQYKEIEKKIENLIDLMQDGMVNISVKSRLDKLEKCREDLGISIAKEQMSKARLDKESIVLWISKFKDRNIKSGRCRKNLLDIFLNSVYLYDDEIILGFNYRSGTKALSFNKLKSVLLGGSNLFKGSYLEVNAPPFKNPLHSFAGDLICFN